MGIDAARHDLPWDDERRPETAGDNGRRRETTGEDRRHRSIRRLRRDSAREDTSLHTTRAMLTAMSLPSRSPENRK